jgi:probable rRNA maturation factor
VDPDSKRVGVTVTDGRGRPIRCGGLGKWLTGVAPSRVRGEIAVALVSDRQIRQLNHRYRHKDSPTDVLSFVADADQEPQRLGDIAIATGVARRQARVMGHSYATELRVLALHGLLHLLGYDHDDPADRGRMVRAEARLQRAGGLREGLIARARGPARAKTRLRPAGAAGGRRGVTARRKK